MGPRTRTHPLHDTHTAAADSIVERWAQACQHGPRQQAAVLIAWLDADPDYRDTTTRRLAAIIEGLGARQAALGRGPLDTLSVQDAADFVHATTRRGNRPSIATMHLRRTAIRVATTAMAALGSPLDDPTAELVLPSRRPGGFRPLDPEELAMLRLAAATRTRRGHAAQAAVALCEAGATTGEVAQLRWRAIDPTTGTCQLPGAGATVPRTVTLTAWGRRIVMPPRRVDPDATVVYAGTAEPTSVTAQAAITTRLRKLMGTAGLTDRDLRPGSIRLCLPAQRLRHGGRIEHEAQVLGLTSLDVAAHQLAWHWQS